MSRLFFQLIFIIVSSTMLSACDNSQQVQKDKNVTVTAPQTNDCLDEDTNDSHQLDTIAAQGCPIK